MRYFSLERVAGLEPAAKHWQCFVLPLYYTRATYLVLQTVTLPLVVLLPSPQ